MNQELNDALFPICFVANRFRVLLSWIVSDSQWTAHQDAGIGIIADYSFITLYSAMLLPLLVLGSHRYDRPIIFDFKRIILTLSVEWSNWLACSRTPHAPIWVWYFGAKQISSALPYVERRDPSGGIFASTKKVCQLFFFIMCSQKLHSNIIKLRGFFCYIFTKDINQVDNMVDLFQHEYIRNYISSNYLFQLRISLWNINI